MTNGPRIQVALLMLASGLLAGCGSSPLSPSLPPPAGVLELTTNLPGGATLVVNPCPAEGDVFWCTGDLQMTFSVVLNRDVDRAFVATEFYTATGLLCAGGSTETVALTGDTGHVDRIVCVCEVTRQLDVAGMWAARTDDANRRAPDPG